MLLPHLPPKERQAVAPSANWMSKECGFCITKSWQLELGQKDPQKDQPGKETNTEKQKEGGNGAGRQSYETHMEEHDGRVVWAKLEAS